jgi:hypothetical protein
MGPEKAAAVFWEKMGYLAVFSGPMVGSMKPVFAQGGALEHSLFRVEGKAKVFLVRPGAKPPAGAFAASNRISWRNY